MDSNALATAIDAANAHATEAYEPLRIVMLRMDEALALQASISKLVEAHQVGEKVESLFVQMTADGRIDCRAPAAIDLCDAFQDYQNARREALSSCRKERMEE